MHVRAKFRVTEKTQTMAGCAVKAEPVVGGTPENEQFYKYTPSGEIKLSLVADATADQFVVGKDYYVDFSPAE